MMSASDIPQPAMQARGHPLVSAGMRVEKFPMLRLLFDNLAAQLSNATRRMASGTMTFSVANIHADKTGIVLDSLKSEAIAAVFRAPEWDTHVAVALDRAFLFTLVEAVFGADGSEKPTLMDRAFSSVEMRLAQKIFEHAEQSLQTCFAPIKRTAFQFDRIEANLDFVEIGPRAQMSVVSRLDLEVFGQSGSMYFLIPVAALAPLRPSLARNPADEPPPEDPRWTKDLNGEVQQTEISLRAVLREPGFTLGDVAGIKPGQVLELQSTLQSEVWLEAGESPLFACQLGQADGHYTLRISTGDMSKNRHELQEFSN